MGLPIALARSSCCISSGDLPFHSGRFFQIPKSDTKGSLERIFFEGFAALGVLAG